MERIEAEDLSVAECWALLRSESVGRVALSMAALPAILPVQYSVNDAELAICLGHYEVADQSVHDAVIAFAADQIDPQTRLGWTVQVQGLATAPKPHGVATDCGQPASGQIVHLTPARVTGHRIRLCPFIAATA